MLNWRMISLAVAFTVVSTSCESNGNQDEEFPTACSTSLTVKVTPKAGTAVLSVPKEVDLDKFELVDINFPHSGTYTGVPAGCLGSTRFFVTALAEEITVEVIDEAKESDPTKVPRKTIITLPNGVEVIGSKVWWKGGGTLRFETF